MIEKSNLPFQLLAAAFLSLMSAFHSGAAEMLPQPGSLLPGGANQWKLSWSDEFDYNDSKLEKNWVSQNSRSEHILSSRWRENANVSNGTLRLINKKESRGGKDWTSGNVWTKQKFQYGYYECRYRYAAAEATNNSFWIMTLGKQPAGKKTFEIDINEGHYPNEVNTNIHNHSDVTVVNGKTTHPSSSKSLTFGVRPDVTIQLEIPVTTRRIRLTSDQDGHFHLGEFRIYNVNSDGFPDPFSQTADQDKPGLINFAKDAIVTASGFYKDGKDTSKNIVDGDTTKRWVTNASGPKFAEFTFPEDRTVGCIQIVNGWQEQGNWKGMMENYRVDYHDGTRWVEISKFNILDGNHNFSRDFQTYGLEWTEKELIFYFNGKELRREKNEICHQPAHVWLSLAVIGWGGKVTAAIDGTFMEVDYVRIYQKK